MRLRHLLWRSVPCDCPPCPVTITARDKTRHLTAMLDIAQLAQSQSMSAADVADAAGVDK